MRYIIGIDQSTQGTKAVLFNGEGELVGRVDKKHRQIINEKGWISHDLEEIYQNVLWTVKEVIRRNRIKKEDVAGIGISNQRETTAAWQKDGVPIGMAVVWQCARAKEITEQMNGMGQSIRELTGLPLSPYFPAAKMAWLIKNLIQPQAYTEYCLGTMDAYLVYRLTGGAVFRTDMSNASRTQLFNLHTLQWDQNICRIFGIPVEMLPQVCDSNGDYGTTTLDGYFDIPVPICSVLGDSHAALYAQGCHTKGMVKATYGTGSSIMMNTGTEYVKSSYGLASSLAWRIDGQVQYVLEGNINYTGAVITWLLENIGLLDSVDEIENVVSRANRQDKTVLVPAFTGLSAPYWDAEAKAALYGMSTTTGRAEIVRAAVNSIAFQITDVLRAMETDCGITLQELRVDGGPARNRYLMQFQSDIANIQVKVPAIEEFSAMGVAFMAGIKLGLYKAEQLFSKSDFTIYKTNIGKKEREEAYENWKQALEKSRS